VSFTALGGYTLGRKGVQVPQPKPRLPLGQSLSIHLVLLSFLQQAHSLLRKERSE